MWTPKIAGILPVALAAGATALLTAATSCTESTSPGDAPVSASVALAPAPNATSVPRGDTVRMWFDMPVDSASCVLRFTLHVGDSTGMEVPGRMMVGDDYRQMMFVPDTIMRPGARYFAHMRDSVLIRLAAA